MRSPSLRNIISLLLITISLNAQDKRMERMALHYMAWTSNAEAKRDSFDLLAANLLLNEGDYTGATGINDRIKSNPANKNMKCLISAKAEFLNENYRGSLTFFEVMDVQRLSEDQKKEISFFKTLDHIHLLDTAGALNELISYHLLNGKDTAGLISEFRNIKVPRQYDLRKARRRSGILPGAGLYYVGEKRRAFGSFFVNVLFLGYTGYSIYTKHYITSVLTGASQWLRFYNGGKRAAYKFGNKKNREAYINFTLKMDAFAEKIYFDLPK